MLFIVFGEMGHKVTSVATRLGMTQSAISRAVQRGEGIAKEQKYCLDKLRKA